MQSDLAAYTTCRSRPLVAAHRGMSGIFPGNNMPNGQRTHWKGSWLHCMKEPISLNWM